jgi:hypothetical protein
MPRTTDMGEDPVEAAREKVGEVYRSDSRRIFATLVRQVVEISDLPPRPSRPIQTKMTEGSKA